MASIKLPLHESVRVISVKLPLHETIWLLNGFILKENIIQIHTKEIVLLENIKSFITTQVELVDKNHIKLKWFGDSVPKVQVFRRLIDEEYGTKPYVELPWSPNEYIMPIDANSYVIKVVGIQNTGSGQEYQIGNNQDYDVDMSLQLPINEKHYYFDIDFTSVYRIEVNI
jgi:hypothetical protein